MLRNTGEWDDLPCDYEPVKTLCEKIIQPPFIPGTYYTVDIKALHLINFETQGLRWHWFDMKFATFIDGKKNDYLTPFSIHLLLSICFFDQMSGSNFVFIKLIKILILSTQMRITNFYFSENQGLKSSKPLVSNRTYKFPAIKNC